MCLWCINHMFLAAHVCLILYLQLALLYIESKIYASVHFKSRLLNFIDFMSALLLDEKVNANPTYFFIKIVQVDTIG